MKWSFCSSSFFTLSKLVQNFSVSSSRPPNWLIRVRRGSSDFSCKIESRRYCSLAASSSFFISQQILRKSSKNIIFCYWLESWISNQKVHDIKCFLKEAKVWFGLLAVCNFIVKMWDFDIKLCKHLSFVSTNRDGIQNVVSVSFSF